MKTCFVIMPFGGGSEEKRKHFLGVYQSIVIPAVMRAGYEASRSDISAEPGNITHAIIRSLLEADLVVADLTEANANVFFELGIRHAFRKSGTIHIVDETHILPFDIAVYRAIKYSNNIAALPAVIDEIARAITQREGQVGRSDNPVHDGVPALPIDVRTMGDDALRKQIVQLQGVHNSLQEEHDKVKRRLSEIDPAGLLEDDVVIDVDKILEEANASRLQTGSHMLLSLATKIEEGGADAFVRELATVLKSPYLSLSDFRQIAALCTRLNLEDHMRATLEIGVSRYRESGDLVMLLANSYMMSPNVNLHQKAKIMLEKYFNVVYEDNLPVVNQVGNRTDMVGLMGLDEFYFRTGKPENVLSLMSSVEKVIGQNSRVIREKARALARMGKNPDAEQEFKAAIKADPLDDSGHTAYSSFLEAQGRYKESYVESEEAIICDPADGSLFVALGIDIFNYGFVRNREGKVIGPLPQSERVKYAVPLFLRGLELNPTEKSRIVGLLVQRNYIKIAQALEDEEEIPGEYLPDPLKAVDGEVERIKS
jgi:tetratricopeptide (TPR) repeat protein